MESQQQQQHQPDLLHLGTTNTAVMAIDDIKVHNDDPEEEEVSCALGRVNKVLRRESEHYETHRGRE